jgi:outer membrane protein assembly factor BamE (lipoprotein component of BamABCDE complex)
MSKKLGLMLTIAGTGALLSGCGYFSQFDNFENSAKLRVGMSSEQVKAIMGEPIDATFSKPNVWYYYVETRWHDGQMTIDECMPVVFKDGKVIGWGNEYYNKEQLLNTKYERPEIEGLK